ncbi:Uncharacterised protein [Mycobacteroides abscessus subsp. abscessus]|nr:Uncharacterised protein [Mycobacteroides abscessus subsp. abscessus]
MTNRSKRQVGFGNLSHRDGRLHTGRDTGLVDKVLECERVHDGAKHAHVVSARTLKTLASKLCTTEEVATTDDDRNLDTFTHSRRDLLRNVADNLGVQTDRSTPECFSGQLEQNAAVRRHDASPL